MSRQATRTAAPAVRQRIQCGIDIADHALGKGRHALRHRVHLRARKGAVIELKRPSSTGDDGS
jgi:hypothetical protein